MEPLALLEELSKRGDIHIGLPHDVELSDIDSNVSDDEAVGSSVWLKKALLETDTQISCQ